jgi:NhaP-type Na+/H+ or K+/H+ antiporter
MDHTAILIIAIAFLAYGLVSQRLLPTVLTGPLLFAAFGLLVGSAGLGLIPMHVSNSAIHILAEITLILVLFSDAAKIDLKQLRSDHNLPVRMLVIGMPLTIIAIGLTALVMFSDFSIWEALLLGAILAPTDAALGQAVITNPLVPIRIRQTLNVESGLNDGIAFPFVLIFAALAGIQAGRDPADLLTDAIVQLAVAPPVGIFVGYIGGRLVHSCYQTRWMSDSAEGIIALALAFIAYELALVLSGNGFVSAFFAGLAFGNTLGKKCVFLFEFAESEGQLLILTTFMVFGGVMLPFGLAHANIIYLVFAVLSLTVLRMAPVFVSLAGQGISPLTATYLGWFGPRGLASVIFGLLILERADVPHREEIFTAMIITVMLSIVLHGLSAGPAARRYGEAARKMGECAENKPVSAEPFTN